MCHPISPAEGDTVTALRRGAVKKGVCLCVGARVVIWGRVGEEDVVEETNTFGGIRHRLEF